MDDGASTSEPVARERAASASICVLASGSSGNCTVLAHWVCGQWRLCLIDAGLSPRKTEKLLLGLGLSFDALDAILLTHLDWDHFHRGWARRLPAGARIHVHERHRHSARRHGPSGIAERIAPFGHSIDLCPGVRVCACLASHDQLGSVAYRFEFASCGSRLGFATDLGRVTGALIEHLRGVDVLAIESNYCPRLQEASGRPWFLKRRITGGGGHLSNEQALDAVEAIGPRTHVVLLHLSKECNDPALVASMHAGSDYALTVTAQDSPSRWVDIAPPRGVLLHVPPMAQLPLFMAPAASPSAGAPAAPAGSALI
jgi:phosphoribosyl 1,2-cyclic phosphodiesterase